MLEICRRAMITKHIQKFEQALASLSPSTANPNHEPTPTPPTSGGQYYGRRAPPDAPVRLTRRSNPAVDS